MHLSKIFFGFTFVLCGCTRDKLETARDQQSYSVGYTLGQQLAKIKNELDIDIAATGFRDGVNSTPKLNSAVVGNRLVELQQKQRTLDVATAAANLKKSETFITNIRTKPGVHTLESGILYEQTRVGTGGGRVLKDDDEITVRYVAEQMDGTVVDRTDDLNGLKLRYRQIVLPGLRKVLQKIPLGAKWVVYLSPEQAFGGASTPGLSSQSALIYNFELLNFRPAKQK